MNTTRSSKLPKLAQPVNVELEGNANLLLSTDHKTPGGKTLLMRWEAVCLVKEYIEL